MNICFFPPDVPSTARRTFRFILPTKSPLARKPSIRSATGLAIDEFESSDGSPANYPQGQPELTTVRITIPAHSSLPSHTHDMPNAAYLLSGHLTVEER